MLYTSFFSVDPEGLHYYGYNHYTVTQDGNAYAVSVMTPEDDDPSGGNYIPGDTYAASALSTAIQIIENLEAGVPE